MRRLPLRIQTELEGLIRVDSYDFNGSILSIKIVTGSSEYLLSDNDCGLHLTKYLGRKVVARGSLIKEPGLTFFEVDEFETLSHQDLSEAL